MHILLVEDNPVAAKSIELKLVAEGQLAAGHARALLGTPDRAFQESLARRAVADGLSVRAQAKVMSGKPMSYVGLERSEETVRWLWDSGIAAVAGDAPGVEAFPVDMVAAYGALHRILIGRLGFALGELFDLRRLSSESESDGRYEFLFTSAPLNIVGGVGSTPNALVIK